MRAGGGLSETIPFFIVSGGSQKVLCTASGEKYGAGQLFLTGKAVLEIPQLHCTSPSSNEQKGTDIASSPDSAVAYVPAVLIIAVDITGLGSPIQYNL